jgi:hypothetical protein
MKPVIFVSGALANKPGNAGGAWERLSWVVGLRRLAFNAIFVEQLSDASAKQIDWFRSVVEFFGLAEQAALVSTAGETIVGIESAKLLDLAYSADLLINLSGHLTLKPLLERLRRRAYVDVDPGFTQVWHADPTTPFSLPPHDVYFTLGANIGRPDCPIPTGAIRWHATRQPVVLDDWPTVATPPGRFTTIASWRGPFGPVQIEGRTLGLKVHEFRRFIQLPRRSTYSFELALDIHSADDNDRTALIHNRWRLVEPAKAVGDPAAFRRYIQQSSAEFSVAQGVYVETASGWFSDRSVRYLASGKPVLVQDSGFGRWLPVGEGVVAFQTMDEAIAGAERIMSDYPRQCRAARALAEEFFAAEKVVSRLLRDALSG